MRTLTNIAAAATLLGLLAITAWSFNHAYKSRDACDAAGGVYLWQEDKCIKADSVIPTVKP
jgi:hypothetical protein